MTNCKFLYDNLWKGVEGVDLMMTALTEAINFPVTNTQRRIPGRRWRSTNCVDDQTITVNFYAEISAEAFCIRGNNFSENAVITIQANTEDAWVTPPFEAQLSPVNNRVMAAYFGADPVVYQFWRLVISDVGNPDGYIEVGPIFLGPAFTPAVNYKNGGAFTPEDLSVITISAGGQRTVVVQDQPGVWQYAFRTSEKSAFELIRAVVGRSLPFWFCEDPEADDPNEATQYVVATSWKWDHVHMNVWNLTLTLSEEM
jgi:hypothetical protein